MSGDRPRLPKGIPRRIAWRMTSDGRVRQIVEQGGEFAPKPTLAESILMDEEHRTPTFCLICYLPQKEREGVYPFDVQVPESIKHGLPAPYVRSLKQHWRLAQKELGAAVEFPGVERVMELLHSAYSKLEILAQVLRGANRLPLLTFFVVNRNTYLRLRRGEREKGKRRRDWSLAFYVVGKNEIYVGPLVMRGLAASIVAYDNPSCDREKAIDKLHWSVGVIAHELAHVGHLAPGVVDYILARPEGAEWAMKVIASSFFGKNDPQLLLETGTEEERAAVLEKCKRLIGHGAISSEAIAPICSDLIRIAFCRLHGIPAQPKVEEALTGDIGIFSITSLLSLVGWASDKRAEVAIAFMNALGKSDVAFVASLIRGIGEAYGIEPKELWQLITKVPQVWEFLDEQLCYTSSPLAAFLILTGKDREKERERLRNFQCAWRIVEFMRRVGKLKSERGQLGERELEECGKIASELRYTIVPMNLRGGEGISKANEGLSTLAEAYMAKVIVKLSEGTAGTASGGSTIQR